MKKRIHGWHIYLAVTFVLLGLLIFLCLFFSVVGFKI